MKKTLFGLALAASLICGCQKINDLDSRMNRAEQDINSLKTELAKLQAAVEAKVTVTSYKATDNGYILSMSDGSSITILNGKDGAPGKDGKDGDAFFSSVAAQDGALVITLVDGTVYSLPLFDVLASVASFVFIPEYSDGLATLNVGDNSDMQMIEMTCLISPLSAAKIIYDNRKDYTISVVAAGTATRSLADTKEVEAIVSMFDNGFLSVAADATGINPDAKFAIKISNATNSIVSDFVGAKKNIYGVEYDGYFYMSQKMADGNIWMTDNLHYVPEGMTVRADFTDNTGIWYPGVLSWDGTKATATASSDDFDVTVQGLLYTEEVALGCTLPTEDFVDAENTQGICPDGWHIPTAAEWIGLVGGCSDKSHTDTTAPYYDDKLSGAPLGALNDDYFHLLPYPYVNAGKSYQALVSNKDENHRYGLMNSMAYFASSTGRSDKQSYAAMITNTAAKCAVNVAYNNLTNGVYVRCIRNSAE